MANLLKRIQIGVPLAHFGLTDDVDEHDKIDNDQQLVAFYHKMLDKYEGRHLVELSIYAMITYSTGLNINAKMLIL